MRVRLMLAAAAAIAFLAPSGGSASAAPVHAAATPDGAAAPGASARAAARGHRCSGFTATNPFGSTSSFGVRAAHLRCRTARRVLAGYWRHERDFSPGGTRTVLGRYRCVYLQYYNPGRSAFRCRRKGDRRKAAAAIWRRESNEGVDD